MATPISLQLYTVRRGLEADLDGTLEGLTTLGLDGIEGIAPGFDPEGWRHWLDRRGLRASSWWGPLPTLENLDEIRRTLDTLGTRWLTGGVWIPQLESVDTIRRLADDLRPGLDRLQSDGYGFALHNHWMEFEDRGGRLAMDWLIEALPELLLELDIYWCANLGEHRPAEMAARYADRVPLVHAKDGPLTKEGPMLPLGQGQVDAEATLAVLDPEWHIIEFDEYDGDVLDGVRQSVAFLRARSDAGAARP